MAKSFNNPEFSDVTIICGVDMSAPPSSSVVAAASSDEKPPLGAAAMAMASPTCNVAPIASGSSSSSSSSLSCAPSTSAAAAALVNTLPAAAPSHIRRFACHKAILAARSDVFAAMFAHKVTTESKTNEVVIRDTDPDIMEQLLHFVYTDKVLTSHLGPIANTRT